MLEKLIELKSFQRNGEIVYDSGNREATHTCIILRHFHGNEECAVRIQSDPEYKALFLRHQSEVFRMAISLLENSSASLMVEGLEREDASSRTFADFLHHGLKKVLATVKAVNYFDTHQVPNSLIGLEPSQKKIGEIIASTGLTLEKILTQGLTEDVIQRIQRERDSAILDYFQREAPVELIVIIGAAHTQSGTPISDQEEPLETILEQSNTAIRVIVVESKTIPWNH